MMPPHFALPTYFFLFALQVSAFSRTYTTSVSSHVGMQTVLIGLRF